MQLKIDLCDSVLSFH